MMEGQGIGDLTLERHNRAPLWKVENVIACVSLSLSAESIFAHSLYEMEICRQEGRLRLLHLAEWYTKKFALR